MRQVSMVLGWWFATVAAAGGGLWLFVNGWADQSPVDQSQAEALALDLAAAWAPLLVIPAAIAALLWAGVYWLIVTEEHRTQA
jgi:hypothetical protein